jgi:hypothetical protein
VETPYRNIPKKSWSDAVTANSSDAERIFLDTVVNPMMCKILQDAVDQALVDDDASITVVPKRERKPVETPLRDITPRQLSDSQIQNWREITEAFKKPAKPREWPYPIGIPQDLLPYVAYHEIGNHPEKPKPSRNFMDFGRDHKGL